MENNYQSLQFNRILDETSLYQPSHLITSSVKRDDPAVIVMTDFRQITPLTIESTATIANANEKMITFGVRLLFVIDHNNALSGLITANDILGERPVKYMKEHGGLRDDILVLDIMTRCENLDSVSMSDVARYKVGDIVETIQLSGRHHVLVTDKVGTKDCVRGIFSVTQVSRQLGETIKFSNRANTFADLEQALVSGF